MPSEMQIKCFMEVANRLSFTRAASSLYITQQACSKYIAALEKELRFPLFDRSTRRVNLTPDGMKLYLALQKFKTEFDGIIREGQQHYNATEIDINFGLMNGTSPAILVDGVKLLKEYYPNITLNWHYGEQHELSSKVQTSDMDIAIVFWEGAMNRPALSWRGIFKFHGYLLLSAHLVDNEEMIPYGVLKTMPFAAHLQFGLSEEESIHEAEGFLKKFKLPYKEIRLFGTVDDSLASVETGECFTVTPPIFQHAYYAPFLKKYPLEHMAEIGCIWNPRNSNPRIEHIVEILAQACHKSVLYGQLSET